MRERERDSVTHRFRLPVNPLQVSPQFFLLLKQEPLTLTWTMFLRLSHRPYLGSDPDLPDTILKGGQV